VFELTCFTRQNRDGEYAAYSLGRFEQLSWAINSINIEDALSCIDEPAGLTDIYAIEESGAVVAIGYLTINALKWVFTKEEKDEG